MNLFEILLDDLELNTKSISNFFFGLIERCKI